MIHCISVENMRQSDAYTIANFVPSLALMHRAAFGVFKAVDWQKGSTAIVVGSGNNGGDGFALACILKEQGFTCTIFTISQHFSADSVYYADKAKDSGITIRPYEDGCLSGYGIVVDCLLGTGFSGAVRSNYRAVIDAINASGAYVVSVDINSGMNGDTGEAELAVHSDLTVTIGYVKTGLIRECAGKYMKRLVCADIGIVLLKEEYQICQADEHIPLGCLPCPEWLDTDMISAI